MSEEFDPREHLRIAEKARDKTSDPEWQELVKELAAVSKEIALLEGKRASLRVRIQEVEERCSGVPVKPKRPVLEGWL